ncbi:MAG: hypothetical protein K8R34_18020 [Methanosarcinales archaeon]|nr:hypothetical protein [Methanosarcinales archaeon]
MKKLFLEKDLVITFEVYNELLMAKEMEYDFVDDIINQRFRIIHLDHDLTLKYEQMIDKLTNLHPGELTSILLCKKYGVSFVTNDKKAKIFCSDIGVEWLDIVDILRLCYLKCVLDRKEIESLISEIEEKDRTRIIRVEEIFENDVC